MRLPKWPSGLPTPTRKRCLALLAVVAAAAAYLLYFTPEKRAVRHRLTEADAQSTAAADARLKPVRALFAKGRKGAKPFAQEALGWGGKWAMVQGLVDGESHREHLAAAFARHVFSPEELKGAIEGACGGYASDLDGVGSEMLVKLRADLPDIGRPAPDALRGDPAVAREYGLLADRVAGEVRRDAAVGVGREVAAMAASQVATEAATKAVQAAAAEMGVQGGVLAAGASSTVATVGLGLVVAFIVDYLLDQAFKMAGYDPEAEIAAMVVGSIDKMQDALLRDAGLGRHVGLGTDGSLRAEMGKLHESRSELRRKTVELMLKERGEK
jgi:hypothetical protein